MRGDPGAASRAGRALFCATCATTTQHSLSALDWRMGHWAAWQQHHRYVQDSRRVDTVSLLLH